MKKSVLLALPLAAAVAMAGCSTTNPYTNEQQTSSAAKGAGIGAVVGALFIFLAIRLRKRAGEI